MARTDPPRRIDPQRRPLPRRQRPASRLVPVELARKLRHPRPRAVQGGTDPWLHHGRQGHEDVQVARQHDQPHRPDARHWRRYPPPVGAVRSEAHTSELQSLMRISYAVFCLKKKNKTMTTVKKE